MKHPAAKLCIDPELRAGVLSLLCNLLAMGMIAVGVPFLLITELGAAPTDLAGFQAATGLIGICSNIIFGILADRFDNFPYVVVFPILSFATCTAMALLVAATAMPLLYVAGAFMGLCSCSMLMLRKRMMSFFSMSEMSRVQPVVMGSISLLMLGLPNIGAVLSAFSLRLPFISAAICTGCIAAISVTVSLFHIASANNMKKQTCESGKPHKNQPQSATMDTTTKVFAAHLMLSIPMFQIADVSTFSVKMFVLIERLQMSQGDVALQMSLVVLCAGLFSIALFRPLVKLFGPFHLRTIGAVVNAVGGLIMARVQSVPTLVGALACDVVATQLFTTSSALLIRGSMPARYQGRLVAFQSTIMQVGQMLAPSLGALIFSEDETYPWYLIKIPFSLVAGGLNVSMALYAYGVGLYQPLAQLKGRDEL